jgi:hypothetical protein
VLLAVERERAVHDVRRAPGEGIRHVELRPTRELGIHVAQSESTLTGDVAPNAEPATTRTRAFLNSTTGIVSAGWCRKDGSISSSAVGRATQS